MKWLTHALLVWFIGITAVTAEAGKPQPRHPWDTVAESEQAHSALQILASFDDARIPEPHNVALTVFSLPGNMSRLGRVLRDAAAMALISVGTHGLANAEPAGTTSGVLPAASLLPAVAGATAYCPLYHAAGISDGFQETP